VRIAADKVRRGGKVLIETVNPKSLYTYAHAFWLDPDHVRPVHPDLLVFLFREARFADVQVLDRSPVEENERLELLSGDDDATRVMNANFERINSLLYGPQDYAILATR
jgi:O-antigen chain-terminating methyltransferase